ncbi:hypothetical protein H2248_004177 [Termitomyces sp. 'cryptogamus']|nr:hypothetical protein H2248_004177 [Termitomyces sp. 'cryptogamus']
MSYMTQSSIYNLTFTCCYLRWLAQPSLFKLFIVRFNYVSIPATSGRRDTYPATSLARLSVLRTAHIANSVNEIRLLPSTFLYRHDKGLPSPQLVDTLFSYLPSLVNLRTLVCHDIEFSRHNLLALSRIPQLTNLELQSCRTSCQFEDFPDFSSLALETLNFAYPFNAQVYFNNPLFVSLLIQPRNLRKISVGPATDVLFAMTKTHPPTTLSVLEIPVSCVQSLLFIPVITSCSSVQKLSLYMTTGDSYLPPLDYVPPDILPNLRSYQGPNTYSLWFTRDRPIHSIDLVLPVQPNDICTSIRNLSDKIEFFFCKINGIDANLIKTIHMRFPSLKHLTISGTPIDIDTLSSVLSDAKVHNSNLTSIELTMGTGESRLTDGWAVAVANMFLSYLIRTYPFLERARLIYQPQVSIVWICPEEKKRPITTIENSELRIEKEEAPYKTNAVWDSLRFLS